MALLEKAREQERLDRAWDMWVAAYPYMSDENYVNFSEFYESLKPTKAEPVDPAEIIARAERIKQADLTNGRG